MGSMSTQAEGVVMGTAVKMFSVAGPVIVFGSTAAAVYGLVIWVMGVIISKKRRGRPFSAPLVGGFAETVKWWVKKDMSIPPEEVAAYYISVLGK